jgi:hypothetical protein
MDINADPIEMSQSKDQTGENHSMSEIQMQPSLEDDIKKKNSEQKFFHDRNQHGLPQDDQDLHEPDPDRILEAGDAEKPDNKGISKDDQKDKDMPELKPGEVVRNKLDDVLNHEPFPSQPRWLDERSGADLPHSTERMINRDAKSCQTVFSNEYLEPGARG